MKGDLPPADERKGAVVFLISGAAALFLGVGWVVQQRVAIQSDSDGLLSWKILIELVGSGLWWLGIVTMTIGISLQSGNSRSAATKAAPSMPGML